MTAVDIAVSIFAKLLEYTARPIVQPFDYIFHHETNINGLRNQILYLENTRVGIQRQVDIAEKNGEIVLPIVQDWLAKVNGLATESQNFLSDEIDRNLRCFSGSCPDLKLIYRSSREAKKKRAVIDELVERGKFDYVSQPARRPPIWPSTGVTATTSLGDLDGFESRKAQLRSIMEALEDDNVNIIGVYGMGGIGKTTFVEEVARQADALQLFDEMVMMVVSHKPNLRKLQGDLAEMLELNLKEEGELLRTARLRERLNQVKKILIILDDVWTPLDLKTIGIPQGNLHKGCKIILTSRSLDVCNAMNAQRNFHMDVLSQVESWNLFRKMAGDSVDSTDLNPIATKVAKRCSGLPLAIVTVARALRHRSKHAWRDALRRLSHSSSSTTNDVNGMYSNIFASLELSFNFLKDVESKSCFLLCSLFKEDLDIPIEYLVRYGTGLRVFQDVHTLEESRDRVHTIIENLKACCLLLDSDVEDCFRMHDVTRDFLLSVASRGLYIFLEKMMPGYLDSPNQNKFSNSYAISFVLNDLEEFPIVIDCPKLQLWRVEGSNYMELMQFSGNFFDGMKELKVVLMHYVSIPSIPSSFLALKKLLTLCLEHCKLGDLSLIKELKNLEILSFMHSDVEKLPKEIGELSRLRLLDLTDCKNLTVIPFGVFSNLSNLECLYMMNSFDQWGFEGQNQSQSQASLGELKHLSHLTTLEMHVPDVNLFPKDLIFGNLVRFKIFVGMVSQVVSFSYTKTLTLALYQGLSLHNGIFKLLKVAQHLILDYSIVDYLEDLNSIVYDLRKGFRHLKCLEVYGYTGVESLIDTNIFPVLESLKVVSAADLRTICYDHLPDQSFCELRELMLSILPELTCLWMDPLGNVCLRNLRTLFVSNCHKLKDIVSQSTARDLSELQKLHVSSCEDLKVILSKDHIVSLTSSQIALPKLKSIKLEFLPSLQSFCPEADANLASVQEPLFNSMVDFLSLEELTLRELPSVKEIWSPQQLSVANFCSLRILIVFGCENLQLVFPSYMQHMLQNLEILSVEWCDMVEEVCEINNIQLQNGENLATLPSVRDLNLGKLPLLKHLWWNIDPHAYTGLKNLNSLHIYECDGLTHLFSLHAMKNLAQLQHLKVRSCKKMKTIFSNQGDDDDDDDDVIVLSELCSVDLEDLPQLSSFCHGSASFEFPFLEMIEIKICPKMKEFVASDVHQQGKPLFNEKVALPNLQTLHLDGLKSLKGIWHTQIPEKSFTKLQVLEVINCHHVLNLGPINLTLQMLEVIHLTNCVSLQDIFTLEPHQNISSVSLTKLVNLVLEDLPNLRQIWWCPNKTHRYQRLASVEVSRCDLLNCIFTSSVARGVPRLQKLKVDSCISVEVVIANNVGDDIDMILPQICSIELENLPYLVSFCGRASALKWTSLKELRILSCSKMAATSSIEEENFSNSIESFFGEKVVFPSLENVRIDSIGCVNTVTDNAINCQNFVLAM